MIKKYLLKSNYFWWLKKIYLKNRMVERAFIGTWEVTNCTLSSFARCIVTENDLNGIRFRLSENGDVTWHVPEELDFVPLFRCETYEYHTKTGGGASRVDLRFGAYAGQIFEFKVIRIKPKKSIKLLSDNLCEMDCVYIDEEPSDLQCNIPFSLLPALEEGYFSNITIVAANKKQFTAHSTILKLQAYDIDWDSDPPPFSNAPEDTLGTILHYLYAECLPDNLTENTAKHVIDTVAPYDSLNPLAEKCELYIKRLHLKEQVLDIVNNMHSCMDTIVENINPTSKYSQSENIASNPGKLCMAIKQSFREEIVAIIKFVYLCDLFSKKKCELSTSEQDEIMLLLKSKVPVYNSQFRRFLEGLKKIYRSMSPSQRIEIASFIVPEIDSTLDAILKLMEEAEKTLYQIIHDFQANLANGQAPFKPNGESLSSRLAGIVHRTELRKLVSVHENVKIILEALYHKKTTYNQLARIDQVKAIARNLDLFIKELPIFLIRLDEIVDVFDDKLELQEFKFFFKVETSKISYMLEKLREYLNISQDFMVLASTLIQRESFTQTLQDLNLLLNPTSGSTSSPKHNSDNEEGLDTATSTKKPSGKEPDILNLVKSLCSSPNLAKSILSEKSLSLLKNQENTDMEFEVIPGKPETTETTTEEEISSDKVVIRAHRAIVAARSDWVRRALSSGMKEAIDKKIVIYDTNPALFRLILEFLYSGRLKKGNLTTEQLVELMLLSDRYELDSLKHICEYYLKSAVDAESVLYFLSLADQYNARILKNRCLYFLSQNNEITESEEFFELPISLQAEFFDNVWSNPKSGLYYGTADDFGPEDLYAFGSNTSSQEDLPSADTASTRSRLETSVMEMRNIIGDSAPKSVLMEVILAADYNLQRAINYYYARLSDTLYEDHVNPNIVNKIINIGAEKIEAIALRKLAEGAGRPIQAMQEQDHIRVFYAKFISYSNKHTHGNATEHTLFFLGKLSFAP